MKIMDHITFNNNCTLCGKFSNYENKHIFSLYVWL